MKTDQKVLYWLIIAGGLVLAGFVFAPFVPALVWAAVLTILVYPLYTKLTKRLPGGVASALATLVAVLAIVLPLAGVGTFVGIKIFGFAQDFGESGNGGGFSYDGLAQEADTRLSPVLARFGVEPGQIRQTLTTNRERITSAVTGPITRTVGNFAEAVIMVGIAVLTLFFLLLDAAKLRKPYVELMPFTEEQSLRLLTRLSDTVRAVFVGVVMVAILQGTLAGIAYWIAGVQGWALLGVLTMICACVPLVGSPVVYIPVTIGLLVEGKVPQAIGVLAFCSLLVSNIDNILRPIAIGARTGMHPMAIFFSLIGGVLAFGPIGLMAGPMVFTLLVSLADFVRENRAISAEPV